MCVDMRNGIKIQAELKNKSYSFQTEKLCWEGWTSKKHWEQLRNKYLSKKEKPFCASAVVNEKICKARLRKSCVIFKRGVGYCLQVDAAENRLGEVRTEHKYI